MSASAKPLEEVSLDGPGTDTLAVGAHGDSVVLSFQNPVKWVALDAETAKQVGECIARSGYAVTAKEDVYGQRSIIVEQARKRLVDSITHLLTSDEIHLQSKALTAQRCVDIMLSEMA